MRRFFSSNLESPAFLHGLVIFIISINFVFRLILADVILLNNDEAISAVAGVEIAHGGLAYKDAVDHRGPLTYYIYALVFKVFGDYNMLAARIFLSIMISAAAFMMYRLASLIDQKAAVLVCFIFCCLSIYGSTADFMAFHTEWPMCFFVILAGNFLFNLIFQKGSYRVNSICFGGFSAVAILSKQVALFDILAFGFIFFVYAVYNQKVPLFWNRVLWMGMAFFMVIFIVLGYFFTNNALKDFTFYVYTYNSKYYLQGKSISTLPKDMFFQFLWFFQSRKYLLLLLVGSLISVSFTTVYVKGIRASVFLLLSFAGFGIALIGTCLSGRPFGHYQIQLLPYVSFFVGFALYVFFHWTKRFGILLLVVVLASFGFYAQFYHIHLSGIRSLNNYQNEPIFSYINENKHSSDKLFVWGFNAEPYVYTQLRPASRYSFCNFQTGLLPFVNKDSWVDTRSTIVPGSREELMLDLIKGKPKFIIDSSPANYYFYGKYPLSTFPALEAFIKKNYIRVSIENSKTYPAHLYCRKI